LNKAIINVKIPTNMAVYARTIIYAEVKTMDVKKELVLAHLDCIETDIYNMQQELESLASEADLKGSIVFKYIKCGKSLCKCAVRGELHGPYPHLQTYVDGKIKTKYLNRKNYKEYRNRLEKSNRKRELIKEIKKLEKQKDRIKKTLNK
jgi:hypothetical protein